MGGRPGVGFPPHERLRTGAEFRAVLGRGARIDGPLFVLVGAPNDVGRHRLGLTVSRRLGKAVRRNRVRRLLRESFRRAMIETGSTFDQVLIPKHGILRSKQAEVDREYRESLRRLVARGARRPRRAAGPPAD